MAYLPNKPMCKTQSCTKVSEFRGYCKEHKKEHFSTYKRDPEKRKVYNSKRWRDTTKHMRQKYPLCYRCKHTHKRIGLSQMTDHLIGFKDWSSEEAWDEDYLFTVCLPCHAELTRKEHMADFNTMSYEEIVKFKYKER